ncbi:unnamed protein product [Chrysoparadoxa australica]
MDTERELQQSIVESLSKRGVLAKVKASLRSEVFRSLEGDKAGAPPLSSENLLVNELIREYLEYNQYHSALSVFMEESGQPTTQNLDRAFIREELGVTESARNSKLPLIYGIVNKLSELRRRPPPSQADSEVMGISFIK